jgi:magnesium transporter
MLRIVNHLVDGYLALRRELTRQLDHWQSELLHPKARFNNWGALLDARIALHQLDEICEDQRSAIQDWIEALAEWEVVEQGHRPLWRPPRAGAAAGAKPGPAGTHPARGAPRAAA